MLWVLPLEAGPSHRSPLISSPVELAFLLDNPKYDWRFQHGPEPGLEGLHVVNASVMPSLITANIHAATLVIAERATNCIQGKGLAH